VVKTKKQQILGGLAAAIAALAFAAPAAQADDWYNGLESTIVRPHDRAGIRPVIVGSGTVAVDNAVVRPDDRAVRVSPVAVETAVRSDDGAGVRPVIIGSGSGSVAAVRPDDRAVRVSPVSSVEPVALPDDRAGVRGPGAAPEPTPAHIVVSPGGFDWTDAGIGAGMVLGLILLGSGMLLVARRHRRPTAAV
jgi:hypothetical protein